MTFFFSTILCFKFRVIAQVILSKKISISDSSERYTFSTRELHLDSHRASEQLMFCCIDQGPIASHEVGSSDGHPRVIIAYFFGLLS